MGIPWPGVTPTAYRPPFWVAALLAEVPVDLLSLPAEEGEVAVSVEPGLGPVVVLDSGLV